VTDHLDLHPVASRRPDAPTAVGAPRESGPSGPQQVRGALGLAALTVALLAVLIGQQHLVALFDGQAVGTWSTVFLSVVVQALPFLVLGVALSAAISAFVPASVFRRLLPGNPASAVPVAALAGAVLPGCECASVPVAAGLVRRGVPPAAALAFLLSAPAINPVVIVATAIAFPGRPEMVVARFAASLLTAVVVGWLWLRFGRPAWLSPAARPEPAPGTSRLHAFRTGAQHDLLHAGGFLVVGGLTAATLNVVVPREALDALGANPVLAVACLAGLAVILAICSEADAFVASSLTAFPLTARLTFLVVGPVVDVKLIALQAGTFGRRFTLWFAPVTFAVAIAASVAVGAVLL
jgi:uncharacterized membrane protein YraQ (UPF0718 family)